MLDVINGLAYDILGSLSRISVCITAVTHSVAPEIKVRPKRTGL